MKTQRVDGTIKVISPLYHGGDEKTGSESLLRRMTFLNSKGEQMEVPIISGNAIRGYLRRLVMADFFDRLNYNTDSIGLYHSFFSGGVFESSNIDTGKIHLSLKKDIGRWVPPVSLLGFAMGNQAIESKIKVGMAVPACSELETGKVSMYSTLGWDYSTRKDDMRGEYERAKDEQAIQMIYKFEVFVPGTIFNHHFNLVDTNELEESVFTHMMNLWSQKPYLGGRSATGHGEIEFSYDYRGDAQKYLDFLTENQIQIRGLLDSMADTTQLRKKRIRDAKSADNDTS